MALLEVEGLRKSYTVGTGFNKNRVEAVRGVSFRIEKGQTYGLVGESGSGKSTIGRLVTRLAEPTAGRISFEGSDIAHASRAEVLHYRRDVQMIFQDPYSVLNSRMTVEQLVCEPWQIHHLYTRSDRRRRAQVLLDQVGLAQDALERTPIAFSGGQRQRIMIARALALEPKLIVADEPVSALDVSVQAQVLNLLRDLQDEYGLAYLFISHDLSVVEFLSDHIGVMHLGQLIEEGDRRSIYTNPQRAYTKGLLAAIPDVHAHQKRARRQLGLHEQIP